MINHNAWNLKNKLPAQPKSNDKLRYNCQPLLIRNPTVACLWCSGRTATCLYAFEKSKVFTSKSMDKPRAEAPLASELTHCCNVVNILQLKLDCRRKRVVRTALLGIVDYTNFLRSTLKQYKARIEGPLISPKKNRHLVFGVGPFQKAQLHLAVVSSNACCSSGVQSRWSDILIVPFSNQTWTW